MQQGKTHGIPTAIRRPIIIYRSGAGWCSVLLPVVFGCLLLGLAALCGLLGALMLCFGGAVPVWPRGSPPCGLVWCILVLRCPVLCSVALCCPVVVCSRALLFLCVFASACCLLPAAARPLCVFWGVVLCFPCPLRSMRCCAALCWCPCVVLFPWSGLFLVPRAVGSWCRCLFLGVRWWLWLPGVVLWWCLSALMSMSGHVDRRWASWCGSLWYPALLCRVLWCCASVSCCGVVPCRLFSLCWRRWLSASPAKPVKTVFCF